MSSAARHPAGGGSGAPGVGLGGAGAGPAGVGSVGPPQPARSTTAAARNHTPMSEDNPAMPTDKRVTIFGKDG